jgi:hypothetical protein
VSAKYAYLEARGEPVQTWRLAAAQGGLQAKVGCEFAWSERGFRGGAREGRGN